MILECKSIKENEIINLKQTINKNLTLAIIKIGDFPENNIYFNSKKKLADQLNVKIKEIIFTESNSEEDIIKEINNLNKNKTITGIMIQKPILDQFNYEKLVNTISYLKDVDGITNKNKEIIPCTCLSVLKVLSSYQIDLNNKKIAILGKSNLVGMPLYNILKENNNVVLCDSKTNNLKEVIANCEIIISAIGKPKYFTKEYFNNNHIVIDVGTNYLDNKLVGDVDYDNVKDIVSLITPVPGGVGQLTPLFLFYNLNKLALQKDKNQI